MNYETVYQTVKAKVEALVPTAAVRLPNQRPTEPKEIDIYVSITETDCHPYTEVDTKHSVSIDLLTSVPVSEGTERIHHIVSRLVTAFDPLQPLPRDGGSFWTEGKKHFVRITSVSQKQPNISGSHYQINVRVLAIIHT